MTGVAVAAVAVVACALALAACGGIGNGKAHGDMTEAPATPPPGPAAMDDSADTPPAVEDPVPPPPAMSEPPEPEDGAEDAETGEERGLDGMAGKGGSEESSMSATPEPPVAPAPDEEPTSTRPEDMSRPLATVISGPTLDGGTISIEDFRGTPVVVKVFAEH